MPDEAIAVEQDRKRDLHGTYAITLREEMGFERVESNK